MSAQMLDVLQCQQQQLPDQHTVVVPAHCDEAALEQLLHAALWVPGHTQPPPAQLSSHGCAMATRWDSGEQSQISAAAAAASPEVHSIVCSTSPSAPGPAEPGVLSPTCSVDNSSSLSASSHMAAPGGAALPPQHAPDEQQQQQPGAMSWGGGAATAAPLSMADALQQAMAVIRAAGREPTQAYVAVVAARLLSSTPVHQLLQQHGHDQAVTMCGPAASSGAPLRVHRRSPTPPVGTMRAAVAAAGAPYARPAVRKSATWYSHETSATTCAPAPAPAPAPPPAAVLTSRPAVKRAATCSVLTAPLALKAPPERARNRKLCLVDGCDAQPHSSGGMRSRVCAHHMLEAAVVLNSRRPHELARFCTECCKFESLASFDGQSRSCRASLIAKVQHAERDYACVRAAPPTATVRMAPLRAVQQRGLAVAPLPVGCAVVPSWHLMGAAGLPSASVQLAPPAGAPARLQSQAAIDADELERRLAAIQQEAAGMQAMIDMLKSQQLHKSQQ